MHFLLLTSHMQVEIFYHISWQRDCGPIASSATIYYCDVLSGSGRLTCQSGCSDISSPMYYFCTDFSVVADWSFGENRLTHTFQALPSITI